MTNNKAKYRVGISGHRDLKEENIHDYYDEIKSVLLKIVADNPEKEVLVVSPLADGADRLIIKVALELDLRYEVLFPMKANIYAKDFSDESYKEFNSMLVNASDSKVIPMYAGNTEELIKEYGVHRDYCYREVGRVLVRITDAMIFLWDGVVNNKMGGTADILEYTKILDTIHYIVKCEREV